MLLVTSMAPNVAAFTANLLMLPRAASCRPRRDLSATAATSVTGIAWECEDDQSPTVSLFTKAGCTLCDEAKAILASCRDTSPHSLQLVDITDPDKTDWWNRYKYDIPVLHVDGAYWAKHRITPDLARDAIATAQRCRREGIPFPASSGQPNAAKFEQS